MKMFLQNKLKQLSALIIAAAVLCCSLGVGIYAAADTLGEVSVINDGSDFDTITFYNSAFSVSVVDGISPDGASFYVGSSKPDGAGIIFYSFSATDKETVKNMQAFSVWVKVPKDGAYHFIPNFNDEQWRYTGKLTAYNIYSGQILKDEGSNGITLPGGFEGYVVLDLRDGKIKNAWGDTPIYSWAEFVTAKGLFSLAPWTYCKDLYGSSISLDTFSLAADYDSYFEGLKAQPLRTMAPYSDTIPGMIKEGTRINLYAEDGALIYYTLDGTQPDETSTQYHLVDLSDGKPPVSPILLTTTTVVKAIAVKDGVASSVATLNYEIEPPYDGPKDIIINNCDGVGHNKCNWCNDKFSISYNDGISPEGKSMQVKLLSSESYQDYIVLGTETADIEQLHNIQALSFWAKIPQTPENSPVKLSMAFNSETVRFRGKIYAFDTKKRTVKIFRDQVSLSDFEGLLIYDIENATLDIDYGAATSSWLSYIKQYGLSSLWIYTAKASDSSNTGFEFSLDSFQIHYDAQALLDKHEIEKIILENTPNVDIVNAGEDIDKVSNSKTANSVTVEESISPDGATYDIFGQSRSGASGIYFSLSAIDPDILSLKQAFSTWIRVPYGVNYTFNPSFNDEGYSFVGTISTYNTLTGETETFENASSVVLSGFEGYVFLHLKDCGIKKQWTGKTPYTWNEFITDKGVKQLFIYLVNSQLYANHISMDSFAFINDLDKFVTELKAKPLRTMAPYSDMLCGAVPSSSFIDLYAEDGADIYYTLDGTTPTLSSQKYTLIDFGNGQPPVSPIVIVSDKTVKAIAVKNGIVSGVSIMNYTIDPPYEGPMDIIVNDGSGEGNNRVTWSNNKFNTSYVDGVSPDSKAIQIKFAGNEDIHDYVIMGTQTEGIEQLYNIQAFSYWVKVPNLGKDKAIQLGLDINDESNKLIGKIYAYNMKDGSVKIFKDDVSLNDFEGLVFYVIDGGANVSTGWGAATTTWNSFIKQYGMNSIWTYVRKNKDDNSTEIEFYLDSFQVHYDMDALFERYDISGLLAKYDVGSAENTNMIVANDCSGNKINGGIFSKSDSLILEKSDYSPDDRCLKINFGKGVSTFGLTNFCTDADAMIADGITFWVDTKDAAADIELKLKVNDISNDGKEEIFEYSAERWYYLTDKNGIISKVYGKLVLPKNFRGWVIVPKESLYYMDGVSTFANGELDCDKVGVFTLSFANDNDSLNGKSIYIDDMSFYLDFPTLVQSRALAWNGQTGSDSIPDYSEDSENSENIIESPVTGDNAKHYIIFNIFAVSLLAVLALKKNKKAC